VKELDLTPRTRAIGTPIFMSPEVLQGVPSNEKSDVYAYALLLWELWTRDQRPFSYVASIEEFFDDVIEKQIRPTLPTDVPNDVANLIRRCWAQDPAQRPSLDQVIHDIDEIIVNTLVKDTEGRQVWSELRAAKDISYPFAVDSLVLEKVLTKNFGWHDSQGFELLDHIIAEDREDVTSHEKKKATKCDKWGKFLEIFGPLDKSTLANFVAVCQTMYFHGDISSADAAETLAGSPPGTFLLRLSSKDACLTLSKVIAKGAIHHQRISKEDGVYQILIGSTAVTSAKLPDLMAKVSKELELNTQSSTMLPSKVKLILSGIKPVGMYITGNDVSKQLIAEAAGKKGKKEHKEKDKEKKKDKKKENKNDKK